MNNCELVTKVYGHLVEVVAQGCDGYWSRRQKEGGPQYPADPAVRLQMRRALKKGILDTILFGGYHESDAPSQRLLVAARYKEFSQWCDDNYEAMIATA